MLDVAEECDEGDGRFRLRETSIRRVKRPLFVVVAQDEGAPFVRRREYYDERTEHGLTARRIFMSFEEGALTCDSESGLSDLSLEEVTWHLP